MEKKVYYKIEYDGGSYNGGIRRYDTFSKALRYARSYVTRMLTNPYCSSDRVDVRISRFENYREVAYIYLSEYEQGKDCKDLERC